MFARSENDFFAGYGEGCHSAEFFLTSLFIIFFYFKLTITSHTSVESKSKILLISYQRARRWLTRPRDTVVQRSYAKSSVCIWRHNHHVGVLKQWQVGYVGVPYQSWGTWTLLWCKNFLLSFVSLNKYDRWSNAFLRHGRQPELREHFAS